MAALAPQDLRDLYEAVIKGSGHPDPLGYVARAVMVSGGDPDYVDLQGKMGFMPVTIEQASEAVGAQEVQSLEGNIIATMAMDMLAYGDDQDFERMVRAMHGGEASDILEALPQVRLDIQLSMYPPMATVEDVIKILSTDTPDVSSERMAFFKHIQGQD